MHHKTKFIWRRPLIGWRARATAGDNAPHATPNVDAPDLAQPASVQQDIARIQSQPRREQPGETGPMLEARSWNANRTYTAAPRAVPVPPREPVALNPRRLANRSVEHRWAHAFRGQGVANRLDHFIAQPNAGGEAPLIAPAGNFISRSAASFDMTPT